MRIQGICAAVVCAAGLVGTASATTRSSFLTVDAVSGVTLQDLGSLQYNVGLVSGATFTFGGNDYAITDVIGFYALSNDVDFNPFAAQSTQGNFSDDSSQSGTGATAGWRA